MKKAMEHLTQGKASAEKTMGDFKKFIMRGNVVDMAVGVIVGGAFGKIVTSLVNDILMPPIGLLLGNVSFSDLFIQLKGPHFATLAEAQKAGVATLNYGLFLNTIINFLIVSFSIFILIQQMARFQKPAPAAAPTTKECPHCCSSIALKATRCSFCTSSLAG